MDSIYYSATTYWVLLVSVIAAVATIWLYKMGGADKKTQTIVGLIFAVFIGFIHWGFGGENFLDKNIPASMFYAIILGSVIVVLLLLHFTSRQYFFKLPQDYIQVVQGLRVFIGAGFLMEGVVGVIPGWFSIMDGYTHIASGFFALVAAIAFIKELSFKTQLLWLANIIGILDILIIVTSICFVVWADIGPHHNMNYVVFVGGPILLWLHYVSVSKLIRKEV